MNSTESLIIVHICIYHGPNMQINDLKERTDCYHNSLQSSKDRVSQVCVFVSCIDAASEVWVLSKATTYSEFVDTC